jgi:small subunit ribosomal protein S17e
MGRIRTAFVKRIARELLSRYPDRFSPDFENNRRTLDELLPTLSKSNRNRIAGYISSLFKQSRVSADAASGG